MIIYILILILMLIFLRMPIVFAFGVGSLIYVLFAHLNLVIIAQRIFVIMDNSTLLCIPLFLFAANLMSSGGTTKKILNLSNSLVGHIRGGLGHVNVVSSMLFAGISGSAAADASGLGRLEIEIMDKAGYGRGFSAAITLASSTIGPIIPPSIIMVIYGITANVSIGGLFLGGIIPGVLMGIMLMLMVYIISCNKNFPVSKKASLNEIFHNLFIAIPSLLVGLIIVGGILGGVFTPSEAGAVAAVYAFILGVFVYKEIKFKDLKRIILDTAISSAMIMIIVGISGLFSWILAIEQVPQSIVNYVFSLTSNKMVILLLLNCMILILGCFLDATPIILIVVPVLLPLLQEVGIDLLHFGVIISLNTMIGLITPPVGVCLYAVSAVAKIPVEKIIKPLIPFFIMLVIALLIVTYVPSLVLFLPNLILSR